MATAISRILRPGSWPILLKLSLDLLLISIIPLALAVWLGSTRTRDELRAAGNQKLQLLARALAQRVDQLIADSVSIARQVSLDDDVTDLCAAPDASAGGPAGEAFRRAQARLAAVTRTNPDHASMFIISRNGVGIASTNPRNIGQDLKFREYCVEALAGRRHVSELLIGKTTAEPGVYFSTPVRGGVQVTTRPTDDIDSGPIIGVAVLKLRGERIWEMINAANVGGDGFAMLVDGQGVIISHPDSGKLFHSFAALPAERVAEINPELRYSRPTIASADMPELQPPLSDASVSGNASFTMSPRGGETERTPWIAGYARMKERPWKVLVVQPAAQFEAASHDLLQTNARVALAVAAVAAGLALWRARSLVRPILDVTDAARQLAAGDFEARARKHNDDEIGHLAGAFNEMVPQLKNAVELRQSLELATEVQQALLPQKPPNLRRLDVHGHSSYCDSTGGDYYDFADVLDWPDRNALIAVGDVTGHGIGAALVMCTARAALRSAALAGGSLGQILSTVNTILTQDAEHRLYMTMTLMVIDPDRSAIRYACAAHDPIIVYEPTADAFRQLEEGSIPLGAMPGTAYEEYSAEGFTAGTVFLLGTDGIWEARNAAEEMFGKERLHAAIRAHAAGSAEQLAAGINAALHAFLGGRAIQDDVTFVVAKLLE